MQKTLTILLLSGRSDNEDSIFAVKLARAALNRGHKVNLFFYGNAVNLSKERTYEESPTDMGEDLLEHLKRFNIERELQDIVNSGAQISVCHTSEHVRGIESLQFLHGIKKGHIAGSFCEYLLRSDVMFVLNT